MGPTISTQPSNQPSLTSQPSKSSGLTHTAKPFQAYDLATNQVCQGLHSWLLLLLQVVLQLIVATQVNIQACQVFRQLALCQVRAVIRQNYRVYQGLLQCQTNHHSAHSQAESQVYHHSLLRHRCHQLQLSQAMSQVSRHCSPWAPRQVIQPYPHYLHQCHWTHRTQLDQV